GAAAEADATGRVRHPVFAGRSRPAPVGQSKDAARRANQAVVVEGGFDRRSATDGAGLGDDPTRLVGDLVRPGAEAAVDVGRVGHVERVGVHEVDLVFESYVAVDADGAVVEDRTGQRLAAVVRLGRQPARVDSGRTT